ncbi:MAG: STAS domain-containing protein [Terracidiphilus sp.]
MGSIPYTYLAMLSDAPLTIERRPGTTTDTLIYSLTGPLTLRNMFEFQSELRGKPTPRLTIFDITGVPYMDSAGMGLVMNQYVHCQTKGSKLIVVGANNRVMDLFEVTKVSTILPLKASIEEAEAAG